MDTFGVDAETAEATIESGTTEMTFKQESKLQEFGYDTENMSRKDADYLLDKISRNHWEVPNEISPDKYTPFAERSDVKVDTNINFELPKNNINSSNSSGMGGR